MTRDEIISMAREVFDEEKLGPPCDDDIKLLARFAALVAAREREECAKACEDVATTQWDEYAASYNSAVFDCTAAIRARGTT